MFQDRFGSEAVEDDAYFLQALRYIHMNPVKAGMPSMSIIGLGDQAVQEAGDRIRAAIVTSGYKIPASKTILSLAPGDQKKSGSHYDLGMAIALLNESGQIELF